MSRKRFFYNNSKKKQFNYNSDIHFIGIITKVGKHCTIEEYFQNKEKKCYTSTYSNIFYLLNSIVIFQTLNNSQCEILDVISENSPYMEIDEIKDSYNRIINNKENNFSEKNNENLKNINKIKINFINILKDFIKNKTLSMRKINFDTFKYFEYENKIFIINEFNKILKEKSKNFSLNKNNYNKIKINLNEISFDVQQYIKELIEKYCYQEKKNNYIVENNYLSTSKILDQL